MQLGGSGSQKRSQLKACYVALAKRNGETNSSIAEKFGIQKDAVNKRAELGERLLTLEAFAHLDKQADA